MDYLQELYEWFNNFWPSIKAFLQDIFYWVLNTGIKIIGQGITWAASLLPNYRVPVPNFSDSGGFLSALNWILPVSYLVTLLAVLSAATVISLTIGAVLRRLRVIR